MGLGVVRGNFLVQRSQLRSRAEIERNQRARLRLARLFRQSGDGVGGRRVLFCTDQVGDPTHLPGAEILLGVVTLEASQLAQRILPGFENALIDRRSLGKWNPGGVDDIGQNLRPLLARGE